MGASERLISLAGNRENVARDGTSCAPGSSVMTSAFALGAMTIRAAIKVKQRMVFFHVFLFLLFFTLSTWEYS